MSDGLATFKICPSLGWAAFTTCFRQACFIVIVAELWPYPETEFLQFMDSKAEDWRATLRFKEVEGQAIVGSASKRLLIVTN
jgi:hypothetical protein